MDNTAQYREVQAILAWWLNLSNMYQPKTQRPRILHRKECWISPNIRQKEAVSGFFSYAPSVRKRGQLFRESNLWQWRLLDHWRVSNWKSLNKSHRGGRLLILMTHPLCSPSHIPGLPTLTHHCGNAPLLFLPFCPRWTHHKPPLHKQNGLSWKCTIVTFHPRKLMWKKIHMYESVSYSRWLLKATAL